MSRKEKWTNVFKAIYKYITRRKLRYRQHCNDRTEKSVKTRSLKNILLARVFINKSQWCVSRSEAKNTAFCEQYKCNTCLKRFTNSKKYIRTFIYNSCDSSQWKQENCIRRDSERSRTRAQSALGSVFTIAITIFSNEISSNYFSDLEHYFSFSFFYNHKNDSVTKLLSK